MIKLIQQWLKGEEPDDEKLSLELTAAALMVEVMWADHSWEASELDAVETILKDTLGVDKDTAHELIEDANAHRAVAHDLHTLTSRINESYSVQEKYDLIFKLWQVAFADGNIHRYEDHMIRRISDLIHISHSDFIRAKLSVQSASK